MILNRLYHENDRFYMKVLTHLLLALVFVDILWLIVVMPFWTSHTEGKNSYWESLSGIHTFTIVLAFFELFLKLGMIALVFLEFRRLHPQHITDLIQFSYSAQSFPITLSK
jgi:hypothetical protein